MSDTNLLSFTGPSDNGKIVSLGDVDGSGYSSALKFTSGLSGLNLSAGKVLGGHDACVDVNNKANGLSLTLDSALPQGQFVATIKGGANHIWLTVHTIVKHGKVCDIITDDYSDQSHDPTSLVVLDCKMADGSPVRVIALKTKPVLAPGSGPYKFLFPWPWLNPSWLGYPCGFIFDTLRRWGFFRSEAN